MSRHFKVLHTSAGRWPKGETVSEDTIKADPHKFDVEAWLKTGAVAEVPDPDAAPTAQAAAHPAQKPPLPAAAPVANQAAPAVQ